MQYSIPTIQLEVHERAISLARIRHQLYGQLDHRGGTRNKRPSGASASQCCYFPFCTIAHGHSPWRRLGDFRDGLMADLRPTPPTDDVALAHIKVVLAKDIELRQQKFIEAALAVGGNSLERIDNFRTHTARELLALRERPLSLVDMNDHAKLVVQSRIREMIHADAISGHLVVNTCDGRQIVLLDDLVEWAIFRKITIEQGAMPGCPPLVHSSYQRIHQQLTAARPDDARSRPGCGLAIATGTAPETPATPPAHVRDEDNPALTRREKQIRSIESAIHTLGYDALLIPMGGKGKVLAECKRATPLLFGGGDDPFKEAWQLAVKSGRVRTAEHNQYSRRVG